ncbi:MAG: hypothetical protein LBD70_07660, partial [Bifidobacteriaceae bacterium]|nr:hypothetical protein [Bifidobacteriaceae bacterium]
MRRAGVACGREADVQNPAHDALGGDVRAFLDTRTGGAQPTAGQVAAKRLVNGSGRPAAANRPAS